MDQLLVKKAGFMINIRKATRDDVDAVAEIYEHVHTAEENGQLTIGWERGVYPERETAELAVDRDDLFVMEDDGVVVGTAILNRLQVDVYEGAGWEYKAPDDEVMVMHTLTLDPSVVRRGYGRIFVNFYEKYALENGCRYLRIDTNEKNSVARKFYRKLGYREIAMVPCVFNGMDGVNLILLDKYLR